MNQQFFQPRQCPVVLKHPLQNIEGYNQAVFSGFINLDCTNILGTSMPSFLFTVLLCAYSLTNVWNPAWWKSASTISAKQKQTKAIKSKLIITALLLKHNRLLGIPNWNIFLPQSHPELAKGKEAIRKTKHNQFPQGYWLFLILLPSSSTIHLEITGVADMVVNTDILLLCQDIQCRRVAN